MQTLRRRWRHLILVALVALPALPTFAATDTPASGQSVYEQACAKCHSGGPGGFFTGAPKLGASSWATRLEKAGSIDQLVSITASGKGKMPPQGGASGLSAPAQ